MKISRVALDLAKSVIQLHAVDRSGAPVVRKALKRAQVEPPRVLRRLRRLSHASIANSRWC